MTTHLGAIMTRSRREPKSRFEASSRSVVYVRNRRVKPIVQTSDKSRTDLAPGRSSVATPMAAEPPVSAYARGDAAAESISPAHPTESDGGDVAMVEIEKRITAGLGRRSIVLVGLMGCGKTSVGRKLAQRLSLSFVDADEEIERAANKTIPEIFAEHGEPYFRAGERRVIARLLRAGPQVLATGGGAFMNDDTRAAIKIAGVSVWLRAELPLLMKRVARRSNRPLLKAADPEATMRKFIEVRYPVYALADVPVDSRDVSHDVMAEAVIRALYESGKFG